MLFFFKPWHYFCRWVNALDPKIDKGAWTKIQDQKLLENVEKFGQGEQQVALMTVRASWSSLP